MTSNECSHRLYRHTFGQCYELVDPCPDCEIDRLRSDLAVKTAARNKWMRDCVERGEVLNKLRAALTQYGDHTFRCDKRHESKPCSCGWDAIEVTLSGDSSAPETGGNEGIKCTHCNGMGCTEQHYDEENGWSDNEDCTTCGATGRIRTVEQYLKTLPANWHEDSSLETWFPLSAEEHARYKQALTRANGFLIMHGHEPVKLEYAKPSSEETSINLDKELRKRDLALKASALRPRYSCGMQGCPGDHPDLASFCAAGDSDK